MATHQTLHAARRNGNSSRQFVAPNGSTINVRSFVDLLEASAQPYRHAAIRVAANQLLGRMASGRWRLSAGAHSGGTGGRGRRPDGNLHITVSLGGAGYHVQLDSRGHAWRITGPGIAAVAPWSAPGT